MTVYVLLFKAGYDDSDRILGIYTTEEKAKATITDTPWVPFDGDDGEPSGWTCERRIKGPGGDWNDYAIYVMICDKSYGGPR